MKKHLNRSNDWTPQAQQKKPSPFAPRPFTNEEAENAKPSQSLEANQPVDLDKGWDLTKQFLQTETQTAQPSRSLEASQPVDLDKGWDLTKQFLQTEAQTAQPSRSLEVSQPVDLGKGWDLTKQFLQAAYSSEPPPKAYSGMPGQPLLQPKLQVGAADDKYEREADRVAAQVVGQINSAGMGQPLIPNEERIHRQPEIQRVPQMPWPSLTDGGEASADLESGINRSRGGGRPLDAGLQASMGQAMGADFSQVRVHTGPQANALNQSIQAKAFTTGQDVFFRQGEYQPGSRGGQELIAHELTHVVQQVPNVSFNEEHHKHATRNSDNQGTKTSQLQQAQDLPIQRKVKIRGHTLTKENYNDKFKEGVTKAVDKRAKKYNWSAEHKKDVLSRIEELVNSETMYGPHKSYKDFVDAVAKSLIPNEPSDDDEELSDLEPIPIEEGASGIDFTNENWQNLIYDEASQKYREEELAKTDGQREMPHEFWMAAKRRREQKSGPLNPNKKQKVRIGKTTGFVTLHGSVMTASGGGKGREYKDICQDIKTSVKFAKTTEAALATAMLKMLHGDADGLLEQSHFLLTLVDEMLLVQAGPETSRATQSILYFAATIYIISKGEISFKDAFSAGNAIFLGANTGGAKALRLDTPPKLKNQNDRAKAALEEYLTAYGKGKETSQLVQALQTNIASYSRQRKSHKADKSDSQKDSLS